MIHLDPEVIARLSPFERFAMLPKKVQAKLLAQLTAAEQATLEHTWSGWLARPAQLLPQGAWIIWLILTGRGWGKTRTGAEAVYEWVRQGYRRIAIVGRTSADVRDVMIGAEGKGESGILNVGPPAERPEYLAGQRMLRFPNGAIATLYTAEEPKLLRGPQHEKAWVDELAQFQYPESWDNLLLGLRLGDNPQVIVTTTPKRVKMIRELLKDPTVHTTTGSTYENVQNLAEAFRKRIIARYEGTRLGEQELAGKLLEDVPGALWTGELIEQTRVTAPHALQRIVVAVDPPSRDKTDAEKEAELEEGPAECGIVVVGLGTNGHGYVLEDASMHGKPAEWARRAILAYRTWQADRIVAEINNGGDMVGYTLATIDPTVPYSEVWASRGKQARAEPISALYEKQLIHHVGYFAVLEDQLTTWLPGERSPDHLDALVWGISELYYPQAHAPTEYVTSEEGEVRISPF